ncbi:MAG TPA: hypothetical protein VKP13_05455 [Nitrospira sp.]|nr:hypothetical protein [Nitrospira sp.]
MCSSIVTIKLDVELDYLVQSMKGPKTNIWTLLLAGAFALVITCLDLLPSLKGVPWYGFFVVPVVWVALWSAEDDVLPLIIMAIVVTILAMIRTVVFVGSVTPTLIVDRLVVVSIIWLTLLLALLRKRARRTFKWITLSGRQWEPDNHTDQNEQERPGQLVKHEPATSRASHPSRSI